MLQEKEMTTLNPSVAADGEQSLTNHNNSITDDIPDVNEDSVNLENDEQYDFEAEQQEMWKTMDPNYLKTVSMSELYDTVYPSRPPVIDGLLYPGTYILAGAPKLGKSFLMAQLAYHVSAGLPLWGYNVHMGSVLYLALEDDYGRLQKRLYQMFGVETSANLYLGTEAHILGMGLTDQLDGFVKDHPDTKLIIVDTLQKIRGDVNDKYSYSTDYQDIVRLKAFTDRTGVCLMVVHHTRKQQSDDKFDMISGTNGLLDAADGGFLLSKEKRTSNMALLEIAGRDQQDQKLHLVRDQERLLWTLEKAETELWTEPHDPLLEAVAGLVNEGSPTWQGTATALVDALGVDMKPNTLTMRLNVTAGRLFNEHRIQYQNKHGHGARQIILRYAPKDNPV